MKKSVTRGLLFLMLLSVIAPLLGIRTVFAEDTDQTQSIIDSDTLKVEVKNESSDDKIIWEFSYKNQPTNEKQRLKFALTADEQQVAFEKTSGWNYDEEWFVQDEFTDFSEGKVQLITESSVKKVSLRIQADTEVTNEENEVAVTADIYSEEQEGPHDLTLPVIPATSATSTAETSDLLSETQETTESTSEEATGSTISEENELTLPAFSTFSASLLRDGIPRADYVDIFAYREAPIYPVHSTGNYLGSTASSDYIKNFDYGDATNTLPQLDTSKENNQNYVGVTSVTGETLDFENGYHQYQVGDAATGVLTKKTVQPTTDPNIFDVEVDVIGGATEIKEQKPTDIALVIDRSGSMVDNKVTVSEWVEGYYRRVWDWSSFKWKDEWVEGYYKDVQKTRFEVLKNAVDKFADGLLDDTGTVRIGLASFQSDSDNSSTNKPLADISKFGTSGFTNVKETLMRHPILSSDPKPIGGTPTFLGVDAGLKLLTEKKYGARKDATKVLIVLTDGSPTFWPVKNDNSGNPSYTGINLINIDSNNSAYDRYLSALKPPNSATGYNSQYGGNGVKSPDEAYTYTSGRVTQQYAELDSAGDINKYSIVFGFNADVNATSMLKIIAGGANPKNASDANTISTILEEIRREILDYDFAIDDGQIVDSLSTNVDLVQSNEDGSYYKATALQLNENGELVSTPSSSEDYPAYAQNIHGGWDSLSESKEFDFTNVNLGSIDGTQRHGFRFNYQVKLKEEYQDGNFYPANGPTYANGRTYENSIGIAVPSVRSESIDIPVQKVWTGDANYTDLRQDIVLQLQQQIGSSGSWTDVTGKTIAISKDATGDGLKGTFSKLPTESISNNSGTYVYTPINYRVIEKVGTNSRVTGYATPVVSPTTAINKETTNPSVIVTNELLTTDLEFTKVREDGTSLAGAEFSLYRNSSETALKVINDPTDSKFIFEDLPVGNYVLKETKKPNGFKKHEDISFTITDTNGELAIVGFPDDFPSTEGLQVKNELNPFDLSVLKIDGQTKKTLEGVTFSLTEKGNETVLATATTTSPDGIGQFKAGGDTFNPVVDTTYVISETTEKEGYVKLAVTLEVTVHADGTLTIVSEGNPFTNFTNTDNHIQLTIENTPKGQLPSTGGHGRMMYYIGAAVVLALIGVLGGYYFYRNRKGAH